MGDIRNALKKFQSENMKGRNRLEDLDVDGKTVLRSILLCEAVDWIHLAHDMVQLLAVVNQVMNLQVPYKAGNFLIT
jgi:hypothetical protein